MKALDLLNTALSLLALLLVLTPTGGDATEATANQEQPNIVLLLADDAGYGAFGFHGSKHYKTPHLDELARSGIRLSHFYVTGATCGPSRAGMLTGRYQQRFGYEENNVPGIMSKNSKLLGDEMGLPTDLKTMGNYLKKAGRLAELISFVNHPLHPTKASDVFGRNKTQLHEE